MTIAKEQNKKIADAALTWVGTAHINAHKQKGVGIDCARLAEACVEDAGLAPVGFMSDLKTNYISDWFLNRGENIMVPWFEKYCEEVSDMQPGDFLLFQIGRQIGHAAIFIGDGKVVHSVPGEGTCVVDLNNDYHFWDKKGNSRLKFIYRLKEVII
jgi:hypothetical protein